MEKRIMCLALIMVLIGSLVQGEVVAFAEGVTLDKTEQMPEKFWNILNGVDEIYGYGAEIDHLGEKGRVQARFKSGVDHTHQYIVASVIAIIQNDFGSSCLTSADGIETLLFNTNWPDTLGNETDFGTFSGHFYDPDTGKNWMGQKSLTAFERATYYLELAISNTEFEKYVDVNRTEYYIDGYTLPGDVYQSAIDTPIDDFMIDIAIRGRDKCCKRNNIGKPK